MGLVTCRGFRHHMHIIRHVAHHMNRPVFLIMYGDRFPARTYMQHSHARTCVYAIYTRIRFSS